MANKKEKIKYWDINPILKYNAHYNVIYGERSNGKTYGTLEYGLEKHFKDGSQIAYIRRWDEDLKGVKGGSIFKPLLGVIKKLSKNKWNDYKYRSRAWFFVHVDSDGVIDREDIKPFAYAFALNTAEHYKSNSYPNVGIIIFDEFLTRQNYMQDEFISFQNLLSTIIRLRDDIKIFMLGNSVNRYSLYFEEMGLTGVKKQEKGTIELYKYGDSNLRVAVEYSDFPTKDKKSNVYFAFNNPKLEMIKTGGWEMDIYPHFPIECRPLLPKEIIYKFYIIFDSQIVQGNIIKKPDRVFLFFHKKTTPIKEDNTNLVFQTESDSRRNYRRKITRPITSLEKYIALLFNKDKVFFQSNEVGEIIRNYMIWCKTSTL